MGDLEVDELVSIKRIMMPAKQGLARSSVFNFSTPAEEIGETFTLSVLVLSDSYFGLDQQYAWLYITSNGNETTFFGVLSNF